MTKKRKIYFIMIIILIGAVITLRIKPRKAAEEVTVEMIPYFGEIERTISTTGTVLPKNRLAIKPPVDGRIEDILVQEGDRVKAGQIVAWMSSTDRAALLDAARGEGPEKLKYWEQVYKPIALIAPIDADVIVATSQPGQTVTTSDAVIVLSDRLIIRAQVDETDIGKIKLNQQATVTLDAYPDIKIKANVEHIYYESVTVNNVTIYNVDLVTDEIPPFFRSGMNATVDFIETSRARAMLLPIQAIHREKEETYVLLAQQANKEPVKRNVVIGISNDKNVEILSGLDISDKVLVKTKKYTLPAKNNKGRNPFAPFGRR
ncbi:MAG: HlyD family efflux transporter periplasmic adaptor subunit [Candidatus Omnitrophica bacterium]|nr:HlyD family efflux transporter periplasmic adaptor subunit [Candidatus Omnitrophota bacterium]